MQLSKGSLNFLKIHIFIIFRVHKSIPSQQISWYTPSDLKTPQELCVLGVWGETPNFSLTPCLTLNPYRNSSTLYTGYFPAPSHMWHSSSQKDVKNQSQGWSYLQYCQPKWSPSLTSEQSFFHPSCDRKWCRTYTPLPPSYHLPFRQ